MMKKILMYHSNMTNLSTEQQLAVQSPYNRIMLDAGPGAGKTRTGIQWILYQIENKQVSPSNILGLTFTVKAAKEMQDRIAQHGYNVSMLNFHKLQYSILRKYLHLLDSKYLGFDVLAKNSEIERKLKLAMDSCLINLDIASTYKMIASAKRRNIDSTGDDKVDKVMDSFNAILNKEGKITFDDFNRLAIAIFKAKPELLEQYKKSFTHLFVDEFHDTDEGQHQFLDMLYPSNLFTVVSLIQSMYSFRDANLEKVVNMKDRYPDIETLHLTENYRCPDKVVYLTNQIVSTMEHQPPKMKPTGIKGEWMYLGNHASSVEEAIEVVSIIKDIINTDKECSVAVLSRCNWLLGATSRELVRSEIAHTSTCRSYQQYREVEDIMGYMKLIATDNPVHLGRVLNRPTRYLRRDFYQQFVEHCTSNENLLVALKQNYTVYDDGKFNNKKTAIQYKNIQKLYDDLLILYGYKTSPFMFIDCIRQNMGYDKWLKAEYKNSIQQQGLTDSDAGEEILAILDEFQESAKQFSSITEFIEYYNKQSDDTDMANDEAAQVHLMTIHRSKGLEFNHTFLVQTQYLPHPKAINIEEEKRIFVVGMTRCKGTQDKAGSLYISQCWCPLQKHGSKFLEEMFNESIQSS